MENPRKSKKLKAKNKTGRKETGHQIFVHNTLKKKKKGSGQQQSKDSHTVWYKFKNKYTQGP